MFGIIDRLRVVITSEDSFSWGSLIGLGGDLIGAVSYVEYELILDLKNICDFFRGQLKYDDIFLVVGVLVSEVFTLFGTVISRCHL